MIDLRGSLMRLSSIGGGGGWEDELILGSRSRWGVSLIFDLGSDLGGMLRLVSFHKLEVQRS